MRLLAPAALLLAAAALSAQPPAPSGAPKKSLGETHAEAMAAEAEAGWARAPVEERAVATDHAIALGRGAMKYKATAGTLTIRDANGKPTHSIFYTAYTAPPAKGGRRAVMFLFNGGPGSATLWLHMGSFAPMRVKTANPEFIRPAPFAFGPNPDTLIGTADLVFLDAPGAGYSRPLGDAKPSDFYGVDQDADAFAKAIIRYVTKYDRWNSPKFILGESYGTTRAGALTYELQERGMAINGTILLSSIMNYGRRQPGLDNIYMSYLPSYAATAWYHNRVPGGRPASLEQFVEEARQYAVGPYASALAKGQDISEAEESQVAAALARFTGLSADFIKRANLRVELSRYQKELLRDRRQTIGRFDSRYTGIDADAAGERPEYDASSEAISGAFIGTFSDYVGGALGYRTDMPYRISARDAGGFEWDWKHRAAGSDYPQNNPNTAVDLAAAMRANPYLKILSLNGWYDMATPFFGTEYDLGHMMLEPSQRRNLEFRYYPAGHMAYLNPDALHSLRIDIERFVAEATAEARGAPPQSPSLSGAAPGGNAGGPAGAAETPGG